MSKDSESRPDREASNPFAFVDRPKPPPVVNFDQLEVNRLLNRGIVFTVIWILGFGSLYAVFLAAKAHRIISRSNGRVRGMIRVWWCYLFGGIGILFMVTICIAAIVNG